MLPVSDAFPCRAMSCVAQNNDGRKFGAVFLLYFTVDCSVELTGN